MPEVSENVAKTGSKTLEGVSNFISKLLSSLLDFCEKNAKYAGYRAIGDWIKKKCNVEMFTVRGDVVNDVKEELQRHGIPFIPANASDCRSAFIIRDVDAKMVEEINKNILVAKGNYYQAVDIDTLNRAIHSFQKAKDKNILQIDNLTQYEAITLQRKCNNIAKGFMVATNKMEDGTYSFAIHAPKTFVEKEGADDLCLAFNKMVFSLYGPNMEIKHQQIDADISFDEKIMQMKTSDTVAYICGANDGSKYLELNAHGFIYYDRTPAGEDVFKAQYSKDDPAYTEELERHLDLMRDKVFCETEEEKLEVLNGTGENAYGERPRRSVFQEEISIGETILAEGLNKLIKENLKGNPVYEKCIYEDKLRIYQDETLALLNYFENGEIPKGYDCESLDNLKKECTHHGIDFSEYSMAKDVLIKCKAESYLAYDKVKELTPQLHTTGTMER